MSITATELKANLSKYLLMAATEDIFITRNGKIIAKLTSPYQNKIEKLHTRARAALYFSPYGASVNEILIIS